MRYYRQEGVQPATALEALRESYTNTDLTELVRHCVGPKPPTRKDDMVALLMRLLEGEQLQATWGKLNPREQAMAAETAWSDTGFLDRDRIAAKYEPPPAANRDENAEEAQEKDPEDEFSSVSYGRPRQKRSFLDLIMPHDTMPRDIQQRLRQFVPKPQAPTLRTAESPPDHFDRPVQTWNQKTKAYDRDTEAVGVVRWDMERPALHDVLAVLRLVDAGKVGITDKNRWPTPAALRQVAQVLHGGDYYAEDQPETKKQETWEVQSRSGPIRAFAWPLLLQAGKLAEVHGPRLALTKAGKAALSAPPHETLRGLWERWLGSGLLDELRRINVIRGQTGKGQRYLSDPAERREAIVAALRECPSGRWVALDEFSRYMRAAGHDFTVSSDPWILYISEQQYGSLGYEGYGGWNILKFRYLLCLLMEYAATLGLLDIAVIPPENARPDFGDLWGTDELAFFSRYDGLLHLRLTGLGAYCLGLGDAYSPPPLEARQVLRVLPNLDVVATAALSPSDRMLLDTFGERTGDHVWRLDRDRILSAVAEGRSARELVAFLEAFSGAALPQPVGRFLADLASRAEALRYLGAAKLIRCADPALAARIANDAAAGRTCSLVGADLLVVPASNEAAFHRALRKLGYVLPHRSAGS